MEPVQDWTYVPVPVEDWTQDQFVPFSPRHVMSVSVQPETNSSPQFPYNIASQQSTNFHLDIRKYSSQPSDDELESVNKAIDDELQKLLSILSVPAAVGENTSASCNAALCDEDKSSEDRESSVDSTSVSELNTDAESNTENSHDISFSTPSAMTETDTVNSSKQMSHHNVDLSGSQQNSVYKVEDWLASDHTDSVSNACCGKKCKSKCCSSVQSSVSQHVPCTKTPSKRDAYVQTSIHWSAPCSKTASVCNGSMSEQAQCECGQSDLSKGEASDDQSACSQCLCEEHPAASASHHSADTQVSQHSQQRQSSKSKSSLLRFFRHKRGKNRNEKGSSAMTVASHAVAAARAKNWKVQNISERCSIFEYKQDILNRPLVHHASFSQQV